PRQPNARPIFYPSRDIDREGALACHAPATTAHLARIVDHLAAAMTGQARALKGEEALCMSNFACTAASRTRLRLGTGLGAASRAGLARHRGWNAYLRRLAGKGLREAGPNIAPRVGAARAARTTAGGACHAEDAFKNVGECRSEIGAETVSGAAHAVLEGSMA